MILVYCDIILLYLYIDIQKNISPNHLGRYLYYFYRLFLDNLRYILIKN